MSEARRMGAMSHRADKSLVDTGATLIWVNAYALKDGDKRPHHEEMCLLVECQGCKGLFQLSRITVSKAASSRASALCPKCDAQAHDWGDE